MMIRPANYIRFGRSDALSMLCIVATATLLIAQPAATTNPEHELIYVVDTDHQDLDGKSQVLAIDPDLKAVVRTYRAGYHPYLAISQDGKRLYLSYSVTEEPEKGTLEVIDTLSGKIVASVKTPNRALDTVDDLISHMALSQDGHLLYVLKMKDLGHGEAYYGIALFDTRANEFLPDVISLPRCDSPLMVPLADRTLVAVCPTTRETRTVTFYANGVPSTRLPVGVPFGRGQSPQAEIATAFASGSAEVSVVLTDGTYFRIPSQGANAIQSGIIAFNPSLKDTGRIVGPYPTHLLKGKVYLVLAEADDYRYGGLANAIAVLDDKTFEQEAFIKPQKLFDSLTLANDGSLYVVDPKGVALISLAPQDGSEKAKITGLGTSPTMAYTGAP